MIGRLAGAWLDSYATRRRRVWERAARESIAIQETTLLRLVARARATEFGCEHGFDGIRSVADYRARIPLGDYVAFKPRLERVLDGTQKRAFVPAFLPHVEHGLEAATGQEGRIGVERPVVVVQRAQLRSDEDVWGHFGEPVPIRVSGL